MAEIRQRDVPEQVVLTARREHVPLAELLDRLRETMQTTLAAAERHGGVVGPCFTVYPDEEVDDGDLTIEFCAPIAAEHAGAPDVRVEPAHREAYVTVRKSQVLAGEVQSVHQALEAWVTQQGATMPAPPREVYFTDFDAAGPDDEVLDVAFPIGA